MQGPMETLRKLFRRDFQPNEPKKLVFKLHDLKIVTYQKHGGLCDDPDRFGGVCMVKLHVQSFHQGKLQQELVGRQWWAKLGSVRVYSEFLWREPKTGRKKSIDHKPR